MRSLASPAVGTRSAKPTKPWIIVAKLS
ncbi:uncharacterized protein METZ01_LOCUS91430 [marine metagenome]|uniref:Uncharacterized protein n=1 Tax=marine metagenome TaxID=408172 RepID=A0A381VDZ3_9ZZZZ